MKTRLTKTLSVILSLVMLLLLVPVTASATVIVRSGSCGANVTYTLDSEGTMTISGTGDMGDYGWYGWYVAPWHSDHKSIKKVIISDRVTSIGDYAFYECDSLQSVTIPNSVTGIGDSAFEACVSLQSVTIPDSVTSIGDSAFSCSCLQSVTIPDSVTSIGDGAFSLSNLRSVTIPDSVTSIEAGTFSGCSMLKRVTIGDGVTNIGERAFWDCRSLQSVYIYDLEKWFDIELLDNPLHEGADLYLDGKKVTDIIIPSGVTYYDDMRLSGCTSLVNVVIPDSVTYIGSCEFMTCSSLQSITIPDSVKSIGNDAFEGCSNLTDVYYSGSESQWNEIDLFENEGNDYLINATKHYNSCSHKNKKTIPETPATTEKVGYTEGVYCNDCQKYISGHTEIPKLVPSFTDSSDAKVNGNDVVSNNGLTVAQLLSQAGKGAVIKTADGKTVENSTLIGTGMILTMADGSKKEIVVCGDADGDGKISASDARLALRASVGLESYKEDSCYYKAANVESNDKMSASDARLILRASVGLEKLDAFRKD